MGATLWGHLCPTGDVLEWVTHESLPQLSIQRVYLIQNMEIPICVEDFVIFVNVLIGFAAKAGNFLTLRKETSAKKNSFTLEQNFAFPPNLALLLHCKMWQQSLFRMKTKTTANQNLPKSGGKPSAPALGSRCDPDLSRGAPGSEGHPTCRSDCDVAMLSQVL